MDKKIFLKIEKTIFYLFLVFVPLQTRIILYQESWRFNEWEAASFYLTDVFILFLVGLWLFDWISQQTKIDIKNSTYILGGFILVAFVSTLNSINQIISQYSLLKLIEFIVFFLYLTKRGWLKKSSLYASLMLVTGGILQSVIAILQYFKQSDLGLRFLGETILNPELTGVAVFINSLGEKIMRPYGTTPHPNILGAYLLLCLLATIWLYFKLNKKYQIYIPFVFGLILFSFLLTFSRTIIALSFLASLVWVIYVFVYQKNFLKKVSTLVFIAVVVGSIFCLTSWPEVKARIKISSQEEAVQLRIYYNRQALHTGESNVNLTGVGIGNFVPWLKENSPNLPDYYYQPIHNIYLLIYSEVGLLGLGLFLAFILFLFKETIRLKKSWIILGILSLYLGLALFDHFFWTLQQGKIIWWVVLSLSSLDF